MMAIKELHDMETTTVHIEMDVPLFKVWRDGLPDSNLWMQLFHRTPSGIPYTLTVYIGRNKEYLKISPLTFYLPLYPECGQHRGT